MGNKRREKTVVTERNGTWLLKSLEPFFWKVVKRLFEIHDEEICLDEMR